jgi:hypothetical protein
MTSHEQLLPTDDLAANEPTRTLSNWIRRVGQRIVTWADSCADYYAAAAMYQELSALSDAELTRRGLSRATLCAMLAPHATANLDPVRKAPGGA